MPTNFKFFDNCLTQEETPITKTLAQPKAKFLVYNTPGSHNHNTHLLYIDNSGSVYSKVHIADFEVPKDEDELELEFRWRNSTEERIKRDPEANTSVSANQEEQITTITLDVPTFPETRTWALDGGLPGFHLKVTVKRQP